MSLGQAFIDIHANTAGFKKQLQALKSELDALQVHANAALSGAGARGGTASTAQADIAKAAKSALAAQATAEKNAATLSEHLDKARVASAEAAADAIHKANMASFRLDDANAAQRAKQAKLVADAAEAAAKAASAAEIEATAEARLAAQLAVVTDATIAATAATRALQEEQTKAAATPTVKAAAARAAPAIAGTDLEVSAIQRARDKLVKALAEADAASSKALLARLDNLAASEVEAAQAAAVRASKAAADAQREFSQVRAKTFADVGSTPEIRAAVEAVRVANEEILADDEATAEKRTKLHRRVRDGVEQVERDEVRAVIEANARKIASDKALAAERAKLAAESAGGSVQFAPGSPAGIAEARAAIRAAAQASRDAAAEAELDFQATARQAQLAAAEAAAAWEAAYEVERTAARDAAAEAELDFQATARQAELAAARVAESFKAAQVAANKAGSLELSRLGKGGGLLSGIGGAFGGAAAKALDVIGTSAKFATIGVLGLGAALVGIGLEAATKVQNARVSFEALAANISATGATADEVSKKVDGLNDSVNGLTEAQRKSIGDDFTQQLINIANTSTLAQSALFDTSQQLLALGFNGKQAKDIILTFGNALAASGKSGGALNDDLKGVVVAISQIQGAGRLLAQDLNQITTRIPGISRSNVYKQIAADTKHLGDVSKVTAADIDAVRKQLKAGGVDSATATKAILEVTQKLPGFKGALQRQNETLSGQLDALKDNVRNALANLFAPAGGDGLTNKLAKQVGAFSTIITKTLSDAAPRFQSFVTNFADTLIAVLPPLVTLSAKLFGIISDGLAAIAPKLPAIVDGFKSLGEFIGRLATDLQPTLSILVSVSEILIAIAAPVVVGAIGSIVAAFEGLNTVLGPLADVLHPVVDAIQAFAGNTVVKTILEMVGAFAAFFAAFAGGQILIAAITAGVGALTVALEALAIALLANPVGLAIAGLAALSVAFYEAWKASQTFRDIVTKVMQAVVIAIVAPLELIIGSIQIFIESLAKMADAASHIPLIGDKFKGIAGGLHDAADAVGGLNDKINQGISAIGDLANTSYRAVTSADNLRNALAKAGVAGVSAGADLVELQSIIAALPDEKRIAIEVSIDTTIGKQNTDFLNSRGIPLTGLEDATGFSTAGIQDAANKASAAAKDAALSITDGFINGLPGSSGGAGGAGSKVKSAAAKAADTFRQAIKDIVAGLDKDFKDTLVNGTRKQIDTALDSLTKKIAAAFKAAGRKRPTKLLDDIQADNVKLKSLADQRDKLLDKIKAATDRFNEVQSQIKDFASVSSIDLSSIGLAAKDATTKLADLSKLRIILPGQDALNTLIGGTAGVDALKASSQRFADALAARLKQIQDFQANIKKLIASGLNKTTIDQIISQGPENGGQLAGALSTASKATIDQINATQKGIDAAAKSLANTAVDSLFRSGEKVVDGLLQGLKDKEKDIVAAMKHIADVLVAEIKKRLNIKSPSQRMAAEVGAHIIPGLVSGMDHAPLRSAMADVADTLAANAPTLAPINLDTLSGLAQAEARLQLDAALAPSSVQLLAPPPPDPQQLTLGKDGVSAIVSALQNARASKEIHAPVTVHAPAAIADPHATAKVLARAIRSIR